MRRASANDFGREAEWLLAKSTSCHGRSQRIKAWNRCCPLRSPATAMYSLSVSSSRRCTDLSSKSRNSLHEISGLLSIRIPIYGSRVTMVTWLPVWGTLPGMNDVNPIVTRIGILGRIKNYEYVSCGRLR